MFIRMLFVALVISCLSVVDAQGGCGKQVQARRESGCSRAHPAAKVAVAVLGVQRRHDRRDR